MARLTLTLAICFAFPILCSAENSHLSSLFEQEVLSEELNSGVNPIEYNVAFRYHADYDVKKPKSGYADTGVDMSPSPLAEGSLTRPLAYGDSFSLAPLIGDDAASWYWASNLVGPSTHAFDGSNELGGGNFFGTPGGDFLVLEGIVPLAGGVDRYIVEVRAVSSSVSKEPWVDLFWAGQQLTHWRLEIGTSAGGSNPISPGGVFSVLDSGAFVFNSSGTQIGEFSLYSDSSTTTSLSGSFRLHNGGADIAGVDVSAIQMYWDILPASADLDLQFVDATNGIYSPGDNIEIHNVTENIGNLASDAYRITFYASPNLTISEADVPLGFVDRTALEPGAVHNKLTTPTLPIDLPSGDYYIGAILTAGDAILTNNINVDPTPITVATPADLSVILVDAVEGVYEPGSQISVVAMIGNIGGLTSTNYSIRYYASTDKVITSGDTFLGLLEAPALGPFDLYGGELLSTLPHGLSDGPYYIGAMLNVSDADSSNNTNYDPTEIHISSNPDIQVRGLNLDFIQKSQEARGIFSTDTAFPGDSEQLFIDYKLQRTFQSDLFEKVERDGLVRVIVGFETSFRPVGVMTSSERKTQQQNITDRSQQLMDSLSGFNFKENVRFQSIPFVAMTVDETTLEYLSNSQMVVSVEEDSLSTRTLSTSNQVVGSPLAWAENYDGSGQTIAILDDGVDKTHPWFTSGTTKVVSEACYSSNESGFSSSLCPGGAESSTAPGSGVNCADDCNHGTHVAGIAAGDDGVGPYYGVGRGADIIAVQVFSRIDDADFCAPNPAPCFNAFKSDQISALERIFDLRNTFDIAAVNMSLGGGQYFNQASCDADNPSRKAAIDNLRSVGIATIIASGNSGYRDSIGAPGCISTAISVGNTRRNDGVSSSSNIYPEIHLLAPGTDIVSSVPGTGSAAFTGTSMSAPHVAGAWAVMKQVFPSASVSEVLSKFQSTATMVSDSRFGGIQSNMPRINLDLAIGEPRTTFGIFNKAPANLRITSIATDTSAPWISWIPEAPFDISANEMQAVTVNVDYNLAPVGLSQTRLLIRSNDPNESPYPGGVYINVTRSEIPLPSAPTGINASDGTYSDKVRVTWSDVSDETSYQVFRCSTSSTGSCGSAIATPAANATSYDDFGANADGTVHHYRVKACNDGGCSDFSQANTGYRQVPVPSVPTGINATDGAFTDRVHVTWLDVSDETSYQVFRCSASSTGSCGSAIATPVANTTSYDDFGANADGTEHYYRVKACNDGGCSDFSEANTGYRQVPAPSVPTGINASDGTYSDKVRVTWSDVSDETSYQVFRCNTSSTGSCGSAIAIPAANTTSYDDFGANTDGTAHHYRVKACNDSSCSDFSAADTGFLSAGLITWVIRARITEIKPDMVGYANIGDTITVRYTFDIRTPDVEPDVAERGKYDNAVSRSEVFLNSYHAQLDSGGYITILNDWQSLEDVYLTSTNETEDLIEGLPKYNGFGFVGYTFTYKDDDATMFNDTNLTVEPVTNGYDSLRLTLHFRNPPLGSSGLGSAIIADELVLISFLGNQIFTDSFENSDQ